ncbi:Eco57I restriction-modification methylase domain-containing protein [Tardisphaera saccharovorans]
MGSVVSSSFLNELIGKETQFGLAFWQRTLSELGYEAKLEELDLATLRRQGAIKSDVIINSVKRFLKSDYVEGAIIEMRSRPTRRVAAQVARDWKKARMIRPFLIFTDGLVSYLVIVPGPGTQAMGEARILQLSDRLYHTDAEVLRTISYVSDEEQFRKKYDGEFLPYQRVRDEFFEGYRGLFEEVEGAVRESLNGEAPSYAQRFLGRLMFLYFLQKKGWLAGDKKYIDRVADYRELNELFYDYLSKGRHNGIPFLNGSLFEKESYMSEEVESQLSKPMNGIFKKAREFFNRYNFTVDESSPLDVEVGIDPALIGTVFENMLPEEDRGNKGTFYTPPSEMSFICRRALANYLGFPDRIEKRGERFIFVDGIKDYLEGLRQRKSEKEVRDLREKVLSIKVLDPAVGSGGFLLMMMNEMVDLLEQADETVGWRTDPEDYKKQILPNLFGFDIEAEAVEIARLRLWLSLVIDQKEPEPLPNLDVNLVKVNDSLLLSNGPTSLDRYTPLATALREEWENAHVKYVKEHDAKKKQALKEALRDLGEKLRRETGIDPNSIEAFMASKADIVVMNPPYVRQEGIDPLKKRYYVEAYRLDKKSDLYAYFFARALDLLSEKGVVSLITSDKWMEDNYGLTLQRKIKDNLVAVYGQRERSFGADVNTAVSVLKKGLENEGLDKKVLFAYLERYGEERVIHYVEVNRRDLQPGKWFFLKPGASFFAEKFLPKFKHKLEEFANIKFGIKTGANEFFYMKDVSEQFEADRSSAPGRFEGVPAKTSKELKEQGLIYVENEGNERFVIDRKDVRPLLRSPKEVNGYLISNFRTLCLYTKDPGNMTKKYIEHGEKMGLPTRPTLKSRRPWYALNELEPSRVFLPMFWMERLYAPISREPALCDNTMYTVKPKGLSEETLWLYLNSSVFLLTVELFCRRLGGAASEIKVEDYEQMPVPELSFINIGFDPKELMNRVPLPYYEELKRDDRRRLDLAVLKAIGFERAEELVDDLHKALVGAVEDRLVKADRPLRSSKDQSNSKEEIKDDQDN